MTEDIKRPPIGLHLSEIWRANKERLKSKEFIEKIQPDYPPSNYPVLVIPGFMASEVSTRPMRSLLEKLGYRVFDWGLGRNYARLGDLDILAKKIPEIFAESHQKITIIGWSLGGLYARRLAVLHPDKIRRVITLGSPYRNLKAPNYANWLFQLIQQFRKSGRKEPEWITELPKPIPVPSIAFYSREDGIVPWEATMDPDDPTDHRNIEVKSSHIGLGANREVLLHIMKILEQDTIKMV